MLRSLFKISGSEETITQQSDSEALSDPANKQASNEVHCVASTAECTIATGGGSCTSINQSIYLSIYLSIDKSISSQATFLQFQQQ